MSRERALVVEDDSFWTAALKSMLGALGFDVVVATRRAEADRLHEELGPEISLIVVDVYLTRGAVRKEGLEFLETVALAGHGARGIVVTNYDEPDSRTRAASLGAAFLLKRRLSRDTLSKALIEVGMNPAGHIGGTGDSVQDQSAMQSALASGRRLRSEASASHQ